MTTSQTDNFEDIRKELRDYFDMGMIKTFGFMEVDVIDFCEYMLNAGREQAEKKIETLTTALRWTSTYVDDPSVIMVVDKALAEIKK